MKQAKNFEALLYNWLIEEYGLSKNPVESQESHSQGEELKRMKNSLRSFLGDQIITDVILKPKVEITPTYGNKVESKADLVIFTKTAVYRFSIKKDTNKSYIHSSGSSEFNKSAFLGNGKKELVEQEFSKELSMMFEDVCVDLQNFESIPKGRTIENHVDHVLETRGFRKEQVLQDPRISHKFFPVRNEMIKLYQEGIASQEKNYKTTLKALEERTKKTLWKIFNEESKEEFARKLVYDLITGEDKFGCESLATAEYVLNSDGLFHIDSPNCLYISKLIQCFKNRKENLKGLLGRLQNVPRAGISKELWFCEDYREIARKSATADLSIKI